MIHFLKTQRLTAVQITELLANSETFNIKKRTVLLKEGETCSHIYFVHKGILRAGIHDEEAKDWTQCFYSSESLRWAGLSSNCLLTKPSDYFIEVLEDAQITAFPVNHFRQLRHSNIAWARFFQCQLMTVFNYLERKSINHFKFTPEKRYLAFMEAYPQIVRSIPQHYIASYIGIVPESLSRIRKRLNENALFS
jgi:CRP/FNR family transcriptional regulator, anaerobic regulatory protein